MKSAFFEIFFLLIVFDFLFLESVMTTDDYAHSLPLIHFQNQRIIFPVWTATDLMSARFKNSALKKRSIP